MPLIGFLLTCFVREVTYLKLYLQHKSSYMYLTPIYIIVWQKSSYMYLIAIARTLFSIESLTRYCQTSLWTKFVYKVYTHSPTLNVIWLRTCFFQQTLQNHVIYLHKSILQFIQIAINLYFETYQTVSPVIVLILNLFS